MYKTLPEECPATITHALVHVNSAIDTIDDPDQIQHELWTIKLILTHLLAKEIHEPVL